MCIPTLSKSVKTASHILYFRTILIVDHQFIIPVFQKIKKMDAYTLRKADVHFQQRLLNMEPRDDSTLTELYARGEVPLSSQEVARELMATDFIYKNTLYGEVIEEFMRAVATNLREMHNLSWKATWEVVRAYVPTALKLMMLSASGTVIPERLPQR